MPIIKNLTHVSPCSCSVSLPDNILTTGKSWVYSPPQSISASLEMAGGSLPSRTIQKYFPPFLHPPLSDPGSSSAQLSFILQHQIKAGCLNGNLL